MEVCARQYDPESDFKICLYEKEEDGVRITEYLGSKKEVRIPPRIQNKPIIGIENSAFENCTGLTSITIPDSVTYIGFDAFWGCTGLTSVTFQGTITEDNFDETAFYGDVRDKYLEDGIGTYTRATDDSFTWSAQYDPESDFRFDWDTNAKDSVIITQYLGSKKKVRIPPRIRNFQVTEIGDEAFADNNNITCVIIPNGVIRIGIFAFEGCSRLTSITIGNSVESIEYWAFANCTSLTSVIKGNNVKSIGTRAFFGCTSLTSINIGNKVESIGSHAFENCISLADITLPNSITSIGNSAFKSCASLTSVIIPSSVTSIEGGVFDNCIKLTAINVAADNSAYTAVDGVLYSKDKTCLHTYPTGKTDSAFTIPNSVISIGDGAFYYCDNLTKVIIPNSVESIGEAVFFNCESLINITIGNSVESIGNLAFHGCDSLTVVTIPSSVESIGTRAFNGCDSLTSVTFQGIIHVGNFDEAAFDGGLRDKYLECGIGTYTRVNGAKGVKL